MVTDYILIGIAVSCFAQGLFAGAFIMWKGYQMGFKASYEIRGAKTDDDEGKGLLPEKKDPAEFALLPEKEKKNDA